MEPNYGKVDAALAAALDESKHNIAATTNDGAKDNKNLLEIFVHTDKNLGLEQIEYLKEKGVNVRGKGKGVGEEKEYSNSYRRYSSSGGHSTSTSPTMKTDSSSIFTASLPAEIIAELSNQPWIRYLTLSRKLKLL